MKERIKELCKLNNISMNKLEDTLGFGKGYISKLGESTPNTAKIQKIADYFHVSVDYLMTGELQRTFLPDDDIFIFSALAEERGYEVTEKTLSAFIGTSLVLRAPGEKQSVKLQNHEIKELIRQMKNYAWECLEKVVAEKYNAHNYYKEVTEEEILQCIFMGARSAEDALAELSTYEDAEIVSFIRNANERKQKLNAAHERTDVAPTSEDILHDEDIMDDDNF